MSTTRRSFIAVTAGAAAWSCGSSGSSVPEEFHRYVRYEKSGEVAFGGLDGETVYPVEGDLFGGRKPTGESVPLADVKLLYPIEPTKVFALAGNYMSHLGEGREPPAYPEPFYKPITCLLNPEDPIVFPPGAQDVHYEAEFVIVMGKLARKVSPEQAPDYILGYTCGNDVSERNWQNGSIDGPENKDLQWWRGKGSDTFGPMGPAIAVGLDYKKSKIQLRLNGEVKQEQMLSDLIEDAASAVSFISQAVTLNPGDVIFTGTPGRTSAMKAGDVVEVEIDGIGILRNPVAG
jgi:2-keto-4-pentenoate hydratase/2-oxohepta-3-ene-1,7-dioic acid hydratase in catechol pathway